MAKAVVTIFCILISILEMAGQNWTLFRGTPDMKGYINELFPSTLNQKWEYELGARVVGSPVVSNNKIVIATTQGKIVCLDLNGKELWQNTLTDGFEASPAIQNNIIYIGSLEGTFYAFSLLDGKKIWSFDAGGQISGSANFFDINKKFYTVFGCYNNLVYALDCTTGKELWRFATDNYVNGTPAVFNNYISFGGCDALLRVVDKTLGKEKFSVDLKVYIAATPAVYSNTIYVGNYDGSFFAVDANDQKIIWEYKAVNGDAIIVSTAAVTPDYVIFGTRANELVSLDRTTGAKKWVFQTKGNVDCSPIATQTEVLFCSKDGYVRIVDQKTGKLLRFYNAVTPITTTPAIVNGKIIVVCDDGVVMMLS